MAKNKKVENVVSQEPVVIEQLNYDNIISSNLIEIASYVNNHRAFPAVFDGCKDSYRRLIYAASVAYNGSLQEAEEILGLVKRYHPHDIRGIEDTVDHFVYAGVLAGEGQFGSVDMDRTVNPHASARYLHISLSKEYHQLIGDLLKEVPMVESPNGPLEPSYIPLPLPLALTLKTNVDGLGFGVKTKIPSFTPRSIYYAYLNDDPNLLELNINLNMDKANSELDKLWREGKGSITYYYNVCRTTGPDGKSEGVLFSGDTTIFTPDFSKYNPLIELGGIYTVDLTDINGPKYFVGRVPGSKKVTIEDIEEVARKIYYKTISYDLEVTFGEITKPIPIRDWVNTTYNNYLNLISAVNNKNINKTLFNISVLEKVPEFLEYIKSDDNATREDIQVQLGLTDEQTSALLSKTFNSLVKESRNSGTAMEKLCNQLNELRNFDPVLATKNIIDRM